MLPKSSGNTLRTKSDRSRSRGRTTTCAPLLFPKEDYQIQTRSRSRSRGRLPEHEETKVETVISSPSLRRGRSRSRSRPHGRCVGAHANDRSQKFSPTNSKILTQGSLRQQAAPYINTAEGMTQITTRSRAALSSYSEGRQFPVQTSNNTAPYGLPMFSYLSNSSVVNNGKRKATDESVPLKRVNQGNLTLAPGYHHHRINYDTPMSNVRDRDVIASPLSHLFGSSKASPRPLLHTHQFPSSSHPHHLISPDSSPDVDINMVPTNSRSDNGNESYLTSRRDLRASTNIGTSSYNAVDSSLQSPYFDNRPARRIPISDRQEVPDSSKFVNSSGPAGSRLTQEGIYDEVESMIAGLRMHGNLTVTPLPLCNDKIVGSTEFGAEEEVTVTAFSSEESTDARIFNDINGDQNLGNLGKNDNNSTQGVLFTGDKWTKNVISNNPVSTSLIESYEHENSTNEEYHDTSQDVNEKDEGNATEMKGHKRKWCIIA